RVPHPRSPNRPRHAQPRRAVPTPTPMTPGNSTRSHFWRGRGLVLMLVGWASLVAGASALTVPGPARAGLSWSFATRPVDGRIDGHSNGVADVACPSTSRCIAVDGQAEITFDPLAKQSPLPVIIDPDGFGSAPTAGGLDAVACPSVDQCTAADGVGRELTFDPALPGDPIPVTIDGTRALQAIACPTVDQCTAVDGGGREVTFDPLVPGTPAPVTIDGDECTFDPPSPGTPASAVIDAAAADDAGSTGSTTVSGIACPSASECVT